MRKKTIDLTTEYAIKVLNGEKMVGKKEYLACKRHVEDMQNDDFEYYFDIKEAQKVINFANTLTIMEGVQEKPLKTRGFQNFILGSLMGWKHKETGFRRFRESYIQMGRQNGKSFLSGILVTYFSLFSGYKMGRVMLAATKQSQARIVYDEVKKFILSDKDLGELFKIKDHASEIHDKTSGTITTAIGRDTKSLDGFRSILGIVDELHAHKTNQIYKLIQDGQLGVDDALTSSITTAGFDLNSYCYNHYKFCEKVLTKTATKETLFIYIAEMDDDDDYSDPQNWAKANPFQLWNPDDTLNQKMIERMQEKYIEAQEKQGDEILNFKTKSLNEWVSFAGDGFVDLEAFERCGTDMTLEDMKGKEAFLGIDLSSGGDLTSIAFVFPLPDGQSFTHSHSFIPKAKLIEHERSDNAPYRTWVDQGFITVTDGGQGIRTDYKYIIQHIKDLIEKYEIELIQIGYDRHNAGAFLSDLEEFGVDLIDIIQSARNLNDATVDYQLTVKGGLTQYNKNDDLFKWSVGNATLTSNSFGEVKIEKQSAVKRIDAVDALIDAWKLYFTQREEDFDINESVDDWFKTINNKSI